VSLLNGELEFQTNSNAMAEFSYSYIPFATRGLVVMVLPFNKYLLKKLFSRNTFISQVLKKNWWTKRHWERFFFE